MPTITYFDTVPRIETFSDGRMFLYFASSNNISDFPDASTTLTPGFIVGNIPAYPERLQIQFVGIIGSPAGPVNFRLSSTPSGPGGTAGPQLREAVRLGITIALSAFIGGTPDEVLINGILDSTEPYAWTPVNSADVIAWCLRRSNLEDFVTVSFVFNEGLPNIPAAPVVTALSTSSILAETIDDDAASYDWRYREIGAPNWTARDTQINIAQIFIGLDPSQDYEVQVRATNSAGDSNYSASGIARTSNVNPTVTIDTLDHIVESGEVVNLRARAADAGGGMIASYLWSGGGGGVFSDNTIIDPIWTAPTLGIQTMLMLRLTVTDDDGAEAFDSIVITVRKARASAKDRGRLSVYGLQGRKPVYALEISHPNVPDDIRVIGDSDNTMIEGNMYVALAFQAKLPSDKDREFRHATIEVDNVGRRMTSWVEQSNGGRGATVRVLQVVENAVVWELPVLLVGRAKITNRILNISLSDSARNRSPGVKLRHDPANSPGLF